MVIEVLLLSFHDVIALVSFLCLEGLKKYSLGISYIVCEIISDFYVLDKCFLVFQNRSMH